GYRNERSEFLMTTVPVAALGTTLASTTATLPHFAGGGGWATNLVLVNPTNNVLTGTVVFMNSGSTDSPVAPLVVGVNDSRASNLTYTIPPRSVWRTMLNSIDGTLTAGSIRVSTTGNTTMPSGFALLSFTDGGVKVSEASVALE